MNKQVIPQYKIAQFNSRHDVTEDQQFKALVEEVGELSEALNTEVGDDAVAEELADIIFVTRSLAELRDINITSELVETIAENSEKDESVDGNKVTKQTQ
jgi:NTP pyrophosphatase (non-canonical NTP hydrolase)